MILYFSGTGNSEYVAKRISEITNDEYYNLFSKLKNNDYSEIKSDKPFVIVSPTYGWQIPHILRDWLKNTKLSGNHDIYFVMTCGGEIGNATKYLRKLADEIDMNYKGCAEIVMPENYIALFDAPGKAEALRIIEKAELSIQATADSIKNNKLLPEKKIGVIDRLKSGIVNDVYYPAIIHSKKFYATDDCIACGKCEKACVLNNIKIVNGKPQWEDNCTHCMACICRCPKDAIEYGNASKNKPRYTCPK